MIRIPSASLRLCVAACLLAAPGRAAEFTPAQRAEIVQILRDALKQDPSILRDAVGALQADEGDRAARRRSPPPRTRWSIPPIRSAAIRRAT